MVADFSNTVIVLPRNVPQTHDTTYERTALADPLAWGVPDLVNMVRSLARLTGAVTVPGLDEWVLLPDKVASDPTSVSPNSLICPSATCRPCHMKGHAMGVTCAATCIVRGQLAWRADSELLGTTRHVHGVDVYLPLQRHLHKLYQGHFEAKPNTRAPPIPTAFVDPPAPSEGMPLWLSRAAPCHPSMCC